jgi:hypothetical protein
MTELGELDIPTQAKIGLEWGTVEHGRTLFDDSRVGFVLFVEVRWLWKPGFLENQLLVIGSRFSVWLSGSASYGKIIC